MGTNTPLSDLNVLAFDCQATGANPARGHLLEVGWASTCSRASKEAIISAARSYLISLPTGTGIPRAVQRMTGIKNAAPDSTEPPDAVWQRLLAIAGYSRKDCSRQRRPLIVHFARFETPFLEHLHRHYGPPGAFPLKIICTHEIARRLLPALPRRGIRAIAGYYGHCMPELKRSADHAIATAVIWQNMVHALNADFGINRLEHLVDWLAATRPAGRPTRQFPMNPDHLGRLPDTPGIYRMSHKGGHILYIGKAKSLRRRVKSYFRPKAPHAEHILEMLTQARSLEITRTDSALEAALLESDEIKHHSPPYNVALRRRQRCMVFCSRNLTGNSAVSNREYPVGPIPAGHTIDALRALGNCLKDGFPSVIRGDIGVGCALLALPPEYAPDPECLEAGLQIFQCRYQQQYSRQSPLGFLTALGARLWRERMEAKALEKANSVAQTDENRAAEQQDSSEPDHSWSPDDVAAALEAVIRQSAYLIRRARWLCLISESTWVWSSAGVSDDNSSHIIFANGAVIERGVTNESSAAILPPGHAKPFRMRQNNIDLTVYDRLRVATTEMRRILAEGRRIELCLRPNVTLGREELVRALQWV
jgi:DNA polymerase III epsilon subunit-like protein